MANLNDGGGPLYRISCTGGVGHRSTLFDTETFTCGFYTRLPLSCVVNARHPSTNWLLVCLACSTCNAPLGPVTSTEVKYRRMNGLSYCLLFNHGSIPSLISNKQFSLALTLVAERTCSRVHTRTTCLLFRALLRQCPRHARPLHITLPVTCRPKGQWN